MNCWEHGQFIVTLSTGELKVSKAYHKKEIY